MPKPRADQDSVSLDEASESTDSGDSSDKMWRKKSGRPRARAANLKIVISLFLLCVLVVSDVFTSSVVGAFSGAVRCRTPTSWGIVLQAIFLVIFFIISVHLIDSGVI